MKPGGPIKRREPMKRTPWPSSQPTSEKPSASRSAPSRGRRKPTGPVQSIRHLVMNRCAARCEVCGRRTDGHTPFNIHHRKPRGMGGTTNERTNLPSNLLFVCGTGTTGCHGWIESHREEAHRRGLILRQSEDPRTAPVTLYDHRTVYLDDLGAYNPG